MKASTVTTSLFALGLAAVAAGPVAAFPKKQAPVPAEAAQPPAGEPQAQQQPPKESAAPVKEAPKPAPAPTPAEAKPAPAASAKPAEASPATPAPKPVETKPAKAAPPKPAAPAKLPEPKPAPVAAAPVPPPPAVQQAVQVPVLDPLDDQLRWRATCQRLSLDCTPLNQFPDLMPYEVGTRLSEKELSRSDKRIAVAGWPYDIVFDRQGAMKGRMVTDVRHQLAMASAGQDVVVDPKPSSLRGVAQVVMGGQGGYVALPPEEWAKQFAERIGAPGIAPRLRDAAVLAIGGRTQKIVLDGATAATLLPLWPSAPPPGALGVTSGDIASGMTCITGIGSMAFPAPAYAAEPGQPVFALVKDLLFCSGGPAGMRVMERMPA